MDLNSVVPLLKSLNLDPETLKNYRPVSLLSFVSKLAERVVFDRINLHLKENDLHCPNQFGYKKNHSCETLLLKLIDDIRVTVDSNSGVVLLILDLSAAFDTVDHNKLLHILKSKYYIARSALDWLRAFLTGRSQRVKVGNSFSDALTTASIFVSVLAHIFRLFFVYLL